jgi:glycosyltransferase involved in cell wall biosynthesis
MRIALVAGQARPAIPAPGSTAPADLPGQAMRVSSLGRTLAGLGHQVTIYARQDSPALPRTTKLASGVSIENLPAGPASPLAEDKLLPHMAALSGQLAQRWRQRPPDIVHAHFWTSGLAALAATRGLELPVVQTFHSLGSADQRHLGALSASSAARVRLEAVIARSVGAVLAGSSAEMSDLTRLGVRRTSIRVVPWGVDTTTFGPAGPVARRTKRPRLLAIASQAEDHGLDTVIRSLAHIPGAELLIAGGPPRAQLSSDPVLRALARLAQRMGVSDRVLFTGQVSPARMPALLRSADLLVHVAMYEPFGLAPLEAMACGTPVVAAAGGSHQDEVVDGTTGVLIPPGSPAALARRIRQLLASPMLLQGYGIAAADRASTRYSWERIARETLAVYERLRPVQLGEAARAALGGAQLTEAAQAA